MKTETIGSRVRKQRTKLGLSQLALASKAGVTQGLIGQIEAGINKGSKHTVAIAKALEVTPEWLAGGGPELGRIASTPVLQRIDSLETADYLRVQHLDVHAGMGDEISNMDHPEIIGGMMFSQFYIRGLLGFTPKEGRLALVTGRGDSMIPTIAPGETLLVDTGIDYFDHDGIYLINPGNGLQVKRLIDRGTAIYVCSDNQNPVHKDFPLPEGAAIVGKVFLRNRLERLA